MSEREPTDRDKTSHGLCDAPAAVEAAIRAAGPRRHVLLAAFALRLARLGYVREVSVTVAGGPEAAEAVRSVLAELVGRSSANPENAQTGTDEAQPEIGGSDTLEPLRRRNPGHCECGANLRQDDRQACGRGPFRQCSKGGWMIHPAPHGVCG